MSAPADQDESQQYYSFSITGGGGGGGLEGEAGGRGGREIPSRSYAVSGQE